MSLLRRYGLAILLCAIVWAWAVRIAVVGYDA
jgi:hypothetical protein